MKTHNKGEFYEAGLEVECATTIHFMDLAHLNRQTLLQEKLRNVDPDWATDFHGQSHSVEKSCTIFLASCLSLPYVLSSLHISCIPQPLFAEG